MIQKSFEKITTIVIGVATIVVDHITTIVVGMRQLWFFATIVVGVATIVADCDNCEHCDNCDHITYPQILHNWRKTQYFGFGSCLMLADE